MTRVSVLLSISVTCFLWTPQAGYPQRSSSPSPLPTLEIAVEDAAGPWSSRDGTGFANDVVEAAYEAVGVDVKFRVLPYARCKYLVKKGEVPACVSVGPEPGIEKDVQLSRSVIFRLKYDFYQNSKKPLKAATASELPRGTVVGVVNEYEHPLPVLKVKEENGLIFEPARDEVTNLKKLALGRLDAAIINHNEIKTVSEMLKKAGVTGKVSYAFPAGELNAHVGFSRKNPQASEAHDKFELGYERIKKDGTLSRIERKWTRRLKDEN